MTYGHLSKFAQEAGFSAWAQLDIATIKLKPEVREMCTANSCGQYGKRWSCPPGCGTLEECEERLKGCTHGILVQTYGDIEDGFDFEAMMKIEADHKKHFTQMYETLREAGLDVLAIGAGCCTACTKCTYPDEPCRFPELVHHSISSYGLYVAELAKTACIHYNNGKATVTYLGALMVKE